MANLVDPQEMVAVGRLLQGYLRSGDPEKIALATKYLPAFKEWIDDQDKAYLASRLEHIREKIDERIITAQVREKVEQEKATREWEQNNLTPEELGARNAARTQREKEMAQEWAASASTSPPPPPIRSGAGWAARLKRAVGLGRKG